MFVPATPREDRKPYQEYRMFSDSNAAAHKRARDILNRTSVRSAGARALPPGDERGGR